MDHEFTSQIEVIDLGMRMHVLPVPQEIADALPESPRVLLRIGDQELRRAVQARRSGSPYIMIGRDYLTELGLREGSTVKASLRADPDPDHIDFAPELLEALACDTEAKARWDSFTLGKQRSLNHYVISAKRVETRIKRAVDLVYKIRTHTLHGDKQN